jgi:membrane protease YdiL (CAAX protease family)
MEPRTAPAVSLWEAWAAPAYFTLYLAWLFATLESEASHWLTMVLVPVALAWALRPPGARSLRQAMETLGLRRGNLTAGVGWALLLGGAFSAFQVFFSSRSAEIQALVLSGRALWLAPLTFLLMMGLAGSTEEVLFRGFLQTRLERLMPGPAGAAPWLAVVAAALLFGVYHLPYAYFNPNWPSAGDWSAAWAAAMGNGVPGGLVLGVLYVKSKRNLLACVVLHSMINMMPAMTMIRFGGG